MSEQPPSGQDSAAIINLSLARALNPHQFEYIFKEIISRDEHGSFVKNFARAFVNADFENQKLLRSAAEALVVKYDLLRYLPEDDELSCGHSE